MLKCFDDLHDIGSFEIHLKVAPAIRPGQVVVYHAWEPFQFIPTNP